jgi:hypothetical protein
MGNERVRVHTAWHIWRATACPSAVGLFWPSFQQPAGRATTGEAALATRMAIAATVVENFMFVSLAEELPVLPEMLSRLKAR